LIPVGAINSGRALIGTCFDEEAFAAVPVVAACCCCCCGGGVAFPWKADSDFTIILSWIALTLATSDGPFTNILLISHARFVGDHIIVIPCGTCPFQSGPAIR
jgi:hypothetical protein